ncbi:putative protocatechuate 3,4-dioxygenase, alpha subunit [Mycobacterium avium subsp. avium 2285 (R)]|nr:putative protocatechuate 3,4-dioxygenase, alpha subunit [Mycobacterium avium subsp. avium 2285 (R)]
MTETACTPGQTVGPFLDLGLPYPGDARLVDDGDPRAVRLHGTVYDGVGAAVPDALVELWQPDGGDALCAKPVRCAAIPRCSPDGAGARPARTGDTGSPRSRRDR